MTLQTTTAPHRGFPIKLKIAGRAVGVWLLLLLMVALPGSPLPAQGADPQAVVEGFMDAWNRKDSAAMYGYLSSLSQEAYPQELFANRYRLANDTLDLTGVRYTIQAVRLQGLSAAVTYDVVLESSSFGTIEDTGRIMRLVQMDGRWGIAWSSMDIFDALAGASTLVSDGALPQRANIYDRSGRPIAWQGTMVAVFSAEQNMPNIEDCQFLLADITHKPVQTFVNQFLNYDLVTVFALIELDQDRYDLYRDSLAAICGVDTIRTYETRVYYGGNAMSHVVGYVGPIQEGQIADYQARGFPRDTLIGQYAIEQRYQGVLAGSPQRVLRIVEPGGTVLRTLGGSAGDDPAPVMLTIDRDLQLATVEALADAFEYAGGNWGGFADGAAAVVLDVKTGQILAMASYPLVDPMLFNPATRIDNPGVALSNLYNDPRQPLANHAVQNQYAPGSVYKVITATAVLNEEIVQPETIFNCDLYWDGTSLGDDQASRSDWRATDELPAAGNITPAQAIMASCNPFFWEFGAIMFRNKGKKLIEYSQMLGLGTRYNVFGGVLPEAQGNLDNPSAPSQAINNAIGQGNVQLPPLQMALATATIANDGTVYKPYLVQQIGGMDGTDLIEQFAPEVLRTVDLQPDVLATVREGMCGAVSDENLGTGYYVFNNRDEPRPNYVACGKTGTAEAGDRPNAWFIAFAPADAPQIAVVVAVPRAGREGSEVAAPIARRILDNFFGSEVAAYPEWWSTEPFIPLDIPEGGGVG